MTDINCAHCGEPWDVYGLRHDGWEYHQATDDIPGLPTMTLILAHEYDRVSDKERAEVSRAVYHAVLSGKGCPHCGYKHKDDGPHRETQLRALVVDGVTDDDPMEFF